MSTLATPAATPATVTRPAEPAGARPTAQTRLDLYGPIHKALRLFMTDTLTRVGRLDVDDAASCDRVLAQTEALLLQMRRHVEHENDFVHAAIEARRPGGSKRIAGEHAHHLESIAALEDAVQALRQARPVQRASIASRLYRHLGLFVAENLAHMDVEETEHSALLWDLYRDDELLAVHQRLMAAITPDEMAQVLHWMAPALTPQELAGMFAEVRAGAPAAVFQALFDLALARLDATDGAKLARALNLPVAPGLMTA